MSDESMDALKAAQETLRNAARTMGKMDAEKEAKAKIEAETPVSLLQRVKDIAITARRINKVWDAAQDLYDKVSPYVGPVLKPAAWTAGKLKDAFVYAAFERDDKGMKRDADGDPIFSPLRLAKAFTVASMMGVTGIVGIQGAYFYGTHFSEYTYVTGKEMIQTGELYEFAGADSLPYSTEKDNGKYYQVEQSLYLPRLIYPEEDVYAMIPQNGVCKIDGYGLYMKEMKWLHKATDFRQKVYDATCFPLTEKEVQNIIVNKSTPQQVFEGMAP